MTRRLVYVVGGLATGALVLIAVSLLWGQIFLLGAFKIPMIAPYAAHAEAMRISVLCANAKYPNLCYDQEIPKLMDAGLSMEDAFSVTRALVARVPSYAYCHVVAHALGTKETAKDPERWIEVSGRCPTDICAYGCFHGVVEGRFASTTLPKVEVPALLPKLLSVCRSGVGGTYTRLAQDICVHGVGHLMMFAAGGDIHDALNACDALADEALKTDARNQVRKFCYEGAFMQVYQSLTPEEQALVRSYAPTTPEQADSFCSTFAGERSAACHRESWPLIVESLTTASGIRDFCETSSDPWFVQQCYNMVFHTTTSRLAYDAKRITSLCEGFSDTRMAQCFAHSASTFVYTDTRMYPEALNICAIADKHGAGERCYRELMFFSTYAYQKGSNLFASFCKAFPKPWNTACERGDGESLPSNYIDA